MSSDHESGQDTGAVTPVYWDELSRSGRRLYILTECSPVEILALTALELDIEVDDIDTETSITTEEMRRVCGELLKLADGQTTSAVVPRQLSPSTTSCVTLTDGDIGFDPNTSADEDPSPDSDDSNGGVWCGVCGDGPFARLSTHNTRSEDHPPEPVPIDHEPHESELADNDAEPPAFDQLDVPEWLDEASFHEAVSMSDDVDELAATLGWDDDEALERLVDELHVEAKLDGGRA